MRQAVGLQYKVAVYPGRYPGLVWGTPLASNGGRQGV